MAVSSEEQPRAAASAAAALARRHDEHVREPLSTSHNSPSVRPKLAPAGVRARPREVRLRREARRPRARGRPAPRGGLAGPASPRPQNQDARPRRFLNNARKVFELIDKDDSGSLAISEITAAVDLKTGDREVISFLQSCPHRRPRLPLGARRDVD